MSQPVSLARFAADERLPRDAQGPVFAEAWQAEAFAITIRLYEADCFTWLEWTDTLAGVLREARERGEVDDGSRYYDHWLAALEHLTAAKGLVAPAEREARKAAWVEAYESTPHGLPVVLTAHGAA